MLEKFRRGICDDDCMKMIEGCGTALDAKGSIKVCPFTRMYSKPALTPSAPHKPTNLYPLRAAVNSENEREFKKLNEHAFTFIADDTSRGPRGADLMKNRVSRSPPSYLKLSADNTKRLTAQGRTSRSGAEAEKRRSSLATREPERRACVPRPLAVRAPADSKSTEGLVNGSRGVIVDWIARGDTYAPELSESQDGTAKMEPGGSYRLNGGRSLAPKKKTGAGGGGFGGEDWREQAADDFMDKQVEQFCPVVLFAVGVTRQLAVR